MIIAPVPHPIIQSIEHPIGVIGGAWLPPVVSGLAWLYEPLYSQLVFASATNISRILDTSGNGNHTQIQGSAGAQPTWVESGIAGRPSLSFDGTGDFLLSPAINLPQPTTTFVVYNRVGAQGTKFVYDALSSVGRQTYFTLDASNTDHYWEDTTTARQITVARTVSTVGECVACVYNGDSSVYRVNQVQTAAAYTSTTPKVPSGMTIGGRFSQTLLWSGLISLILQYNRALSATEITQVEAAIRLRWPVW